MPMEADDGKRATMGVVVSLLEVGDGTTRVILDDVRSETPRRQTSWKFDALYTQKRLDSRQLDSMSISDEEYRGLGEALLARLRALGGRGK